MYTIWHNSKCSKSRATLKILEENNITPTERYYLETPPSIDELKDICEILQLPPLAITRVNESFWKTENINPKKLSDEELITALHNFPQGIERPIVIKINTISGKKSARIGRPPENVLEIL